MNTPTTPQAAQVLSDAKQALQGLLSNIRRDAPHLSGKAMGLAEQVIEQIAKLHAAPQAAHGVGDVVAWRYKVPTHDGMGTWTFTKPQPECILEAQPLYAHPATSPAVAVPDDVLSVALRPWNFSNAEVELVASRIVAALAIQQEGQAK
jgi:hypothetical protein